MAGFVKLTRPDGESLWVRPGHVSCVEPCTKGDVWPIAAVTVITESGRPRPVCEVPEAVVRMLESP